MQHFTRGMITTEPARTTVRRSSDGTRTPERTVTILIVDDHPLVREGLSRVVAAEPTFRVVGEADSIEQALSLELDDVDVCTLDLSLPGIGGIEGIRVLHHRWPMTRILVLTVHGEESHAPLCAKRGASGFLSKSAPPNEIRAAIATLAAGGRHFNHSTPTEVAAGAEMHLSARELQVLLLLAQGQRITDIARTMGLSVKTVSTHKMKLQHKLGASNTAQIIGMARSQGILP